MKRYILSFMTLLMVCSLMAQIVEPVHFKSRIETGKNGEGQLVFSATIDEGWHVYSTNLGSDGPISATFNPVKMEGVETIGKLQTRGHEKKQYDKLFGMELRFFEKAVTFVQRIRFTQPTYHIDCYIEYGACSDQTCLPPSEATLKATGKAPVAEQKEQDRGDQQSSPATDQESVATTLSADTTQSEAHAP